RPVMAEFVAEQIEGPVGVLTSAQRFADQHSMPDNLLVFSVSVLSCVAAHHKAKSAFLKIDVASPRLGNPFARATRRLDHDGLAGGALAQRRCLAGLALLVRRGCGAAIDIERPLDMVLGQTVAKHGAGMVEDHGVGLAISRAQDATDHLPE